MSVYPANKETLGWFKDKLPPRENEPAHLYLARLQEAGLAQVLDRNSAHHVKTYRKAVEEAERLDVPLLIADPLPATLDPSKVLRLTRSEAKDPYRYREARDRAASLGARLVLVDG
jgi:hypothetical protein